MPWNYMQVEIVPADSLIRPLIGPGNLDHGRAHAEIQSILDRVPGLRTIAGAWRRGAQDDTVSAGTFCWTLYEHPSEEDPRRAALAWLEDYAATIRAAGIPNVQVAALPPE